MGFGSVFVLFRTCLPLRKYTCVATSRAAPEDFVPVKPSTQRGGVARALEVGLGELHAGLPGATEFSIYNSKC